MTFHIDSREPATYRKVALSLGFTQLALDYGDYSSEHCIVERKTIGDFVNSIYARYGKTGRLWEQLDRLSEYAKQREVVPFVLIHGDLQKFLREFADQGHVLNLNAVYGALASTAVRYDITLIWIELESPEAVVSTIKSILEKVEEGKHLLPRRKKLKEYAANRNLAAIMRAFDLTVRQARPLVDRFKTLAGVIDAAVHSPSEIYVLPGVGPQTLRKIREIAGIERS